MTRTFLPALTLCAVLAGSAASAQPVSSDPVAVKVSYTQAELASPEGAESIAARIRTAARQACGGNNPVVASGGHFQSCQRRAIARADRSLDAPLVTAALGLPRPTALADR